MADRGRGPFPGVICRGLLDREAIRSLEVEPPRGGDLLPLVAALMHQRDVIPSSWRDPLRGALGLMTALGHQTRGRVMTARAQALGLREGEIFPLRPGVQGEKPCRAVVLAIPWGQGLDERQRPFLPLLVSRAQEVAEEHGAVWALLTNGPEWRLLHTAGCDPSSYLAVEMTADQDLADSARLLSSLLGPQALSPSRSPSPLDRAHRMWASQRQRKQLIWGEALGKASLALADELGPLRHGEAREVAAMLVLRLFLLAVAPWSPSLRARAMELLLDFRSSLWGSQLWGLLLEAGMAERSRTPALLELESLLGGLSGQRVRPALDLVAQAAGVGDLEDLTERDFAAVGEGVIAVGGAERSNGVAYTPWPVVDLVVSRALAPILSKKGRSLQGDTVQSVGSYLSLAVLDPAVGSGRFLALARDRIVRAMDLDPKLSLDEGLPPLMRSDQPHGPGLHALRRLVSSRCLYGVDVDPVAVEVTRCHLWFGAAMPHWPPVFLEHRIRRGDALLGAVIDRGQEGGKLMVATTLAHDLAHRVQAMDDLDDTSLAGRHRKLETYRREVEAYRLVHQARYDQEAAWRTRSGLSGGEKGDNGGHPFFHWPLAFAEVFTAHPRHLSKGFDAVVGNPPYLRIQHLRQIHGPWVDQLVEQYVSAEGSFDLSGPFLERALELLDRHGRASMIVPNRFMKSDAGKGLRQLLAVGVLEIVDLGQNQLFAGLGTYTCVITVAKASRASMRHLFVPPLALEEMTGLLTALRGGHLPSPVKETQVPRSRLGAGTWDVPDSRHLKTLDRLLSLRPTLEEVASRIFQGLVTSANSVYVLESLGPGKGRLVPVRSRVTGQEMLLEEELAKPLISGQGVLAAFRAPRPSGRLLFPYREGRLLSPQELQEHYPRCWAYLLQSKDILEAREGGRMKVPGWYGYVYPKNLTLFDRPKLIVQVLSDRARVTHDSSSMVFTGGGNGGFVGITLTEGVDVHTHYVMALLNSTVLDWAIKQMSPIFRGGFYSYSPRFLKRLPIPPLDDEAPPSLPSLSQVQCGGLQALAPVLLWLEARPGKAVPRALHDLMVEMVGLALDASVPREGIKEMLHGLDRLCAAAFRVQWDDLEG